MISVNRAADALVQKLCNNVDGYGLAVSKTESGATLIDAGIEAKGGFAAGKIITEICMGGCGKANVLMKEYDHLELPTIFVHTDHPAIATLGSQFAGWQIKSHGFFALGSGPARALALKPKEVYEKIHYKDRANNATIVLETGKKPPEELIKKLASECKIAPNRLAIILTPTTSIAGSTQISGRIVETGMHRLTKLGLDPTSIIHAWGYAPIMPVHPEFAEAMGRTNDAIMYGGVTYYALSGNDDEKLKAIVCKASSSASKHYGKPFKEILREANNDFYHIDSNLFAPAVLVMNNLETGTVFRTGETNIRALKRSIGLTNSGLRMTPKTKARIVIGSLKGNIYGLGKDMVAAALESAGFKVTDLGVNVSPEEFVDAAEKQKANIIAISIAESETVPFLRTIPEILRKRHLGDTVKVVIGGSAVSEKTRADYGFDAYAKDALDCVKKVQALLSNAR